MIKVSPEKNEEKIKEILSRHALDEDCSILSAYENGEIVGYAVGKPNGHAFDIKAFCVISCKDYTKQSAEEKFIAELLIRSVGNYACNREMILLTGEDNNLFFTAVQLGINSSSDSVRIFIPQLFKKCDSCKD